MHESDLGHAARDDAPDAFEAVVEAYQRPIYNLCYRMLGEPGAAEDAAQETFLRAFQHRASYDPARPFKTWLLSIASHYCVDRLRRRRLIWLSADDDLLLDHPSLTESSPRPETVVIRREESAQIQQFLDGLRPHDRCAIILRYWHGLSYVEIAAVLGATVASVKSRLHRARQTLAGALTHTMGRELAHSGMAEV